MPPQRTLDQFFQRMSQAKAIAWKSHPTDRLLRDFLTRDLRSTWTPSTEHFEKLLQERLEQWTATDVHAHLLTCQVCAGRIERLRRPMGRFVVWLDELAQRLPSWVFAPPVYRTHGVAYIAATIALFVLPIASLDSATSAPAPLGLLSQLFQKVNWLALLLTLAWLGWSLLTLLHFLLLRHKKLW
jgi:hypothetical protein